MLQQLASSALHAALNRRATLVGRAARTMASMPSPKKEELKNWTCDEVIECASSIISAETLNVDALKAAQLNGKNLLELTQNQKLIDGLTRDGLNRTVVLYASSPALSANSWRQVCLLATLFSLHVYPSFPPRCT